MREPQKTRLVGRVGCSSLKERYLFLQESARQTTQHTAQAAQTPQCAAQVTQARRRTPLVLLQRAQQIHCPLRLRGVVAQRAQQERQRCAHGALRLRGVGAQLLRYLLQRRALQLG